MFPLMLQNFNLQTLNTLQVPCTAKYYTEITSTYQLLQVLETEERTKEKHWILGGGSNTLFVSDFFDGIVLNIAIKGIKILKENDETIEVQVGAGESWDDLMQKAIQEKR